MKLGDFKNISENEIELLEVAGFTDAVDFLDFNSEALTAELAKANSVLNILSEAPSCLLYTSPSPRDLSTTRMPSSA